MIRLTQLIEQENLVVKDVAIMLHTPKEAQLRRVLPDYVIQKTHLFNAYQSSHSGPATATLRGRKYVASFVAMDDGTLVLAGVYLIGGVRSRVIAELRTDPDVIALNSAFNVYPEITGDPAAVVSWFDLRLTSHMGEYVGRLRIKTKLTQTYVRLAETFENEAGKIIAIERESVLSAHAPDWNKCIATGAFLRELPQSWAVRLREWKGVYLIIDTDGKRYVGSAAGADGLLGRWRDHIAMDANCAVELKKRDPAGFRFSILEVASKGDTVEDIVAMETNWKARLLTRDAWGLNKN